jgi:hypothetical protein
MPISEIIILPAFGALPVAITAFFRYNEQNKETGRKNSP